MFSHLPRQAVLAVRHCENAARVENLASYLWSSVLRQPIWTRFERMLCNQALDSLKSFRVQLVDGTVQFGTLDRSLFNNTDEYFQSAQTLVQGLANSYERPLLAEPQEHLAEQCFSLSLYACGDGGTRLLSKSYLSCSTAALNPAIPPQPKRSLEALDSLQRISLVAQVDNEDLLGLYLRGDTFCFYLSAKENGGMVVEEANEIPKIGLEIGLGSIVLRASDLEQLRPGSEISLDTSEPLVGYLKTPEGVKVAEITVARESEEFVLRITELLY